MESLNPVKLCPVCERALPARKGTRGANKEVHRECGILRSRLELVKSLLEEIEFGSEKAVKKMRGDIFATVNHTLRASVVKINPETNDEIDADLIGQYKARRKSRARAAGNGPAPVVKRVAGGRKAKEAPIG